MGERNSLLAPMGRGRYTKSIPTLLIKVKSEAEAPD